MKNKLPKKISFFVILILTIVISLMVVFSYHFFKTFYKEHLSHEVLDQLRTYSTLIEKNVDQELLNYLIIEKNRHRHVQVIYFDEDIVPLFSSSPVSTEWIDEYEEWIKGNVSYNEQIIEYVDTGIDFHIPHVWAVQPIYVENKVQGFIFIDQDTVEFEQTKLKLLLLLTFMGGLTLIIAAALTLYLTNTVSKPLIKISKETKKIAKGNFDITLPIETKDEVGQLAEDIRLMTKQLKEYRDSKQQFISHISHDLRTPITYIKGYSAIMRDSICYDETEWKKNLQVIYNEATRLEHLVSDLFQLTKLQEGKIALTLETVDVLPWIHSILATRQLMFDNQSIEVEVNSNIDEIILKVDSQRLAQAIVNIIENSIRHTPKNGKITISIREESTEVIFAIKDSGIGIAEKDLPYIWERFYRVDKSRTSSSGGSGLGLAIVKEIVEIHGGSVSVTSKLNTGTTFYIRIPKIS
ncbi:MAG: HAMP domain-containing histidine kinase [Bacillaceae bacterium]|nr:HAMP domain-containing histidine kinase [Bacillaceae bacterium]